MLLILQGTARGQQGKKLPCSRGVGEGWNSAGDNDNHRNSSLVSGWGIITSLPFGNRVTRLETFVDILVAESKCNWRN